MKEGGFWIHTDEAEDVAAGVRHALRCIQLTSDDEQAWKWAALALHSALQGACICHLVTAASPIGAVTTRNAAEWIEYFEASRANPKARAPKTYLLALPDLVKGVRKSHSAGDRSNAAGVHITTQEQNWLRRFHEDIRNQFVHFEPRGWSLEVSGIPELAKLIARTIEDILDMGWAFRHKDEEWKQALRADLTALGTSD